MLPGKFKSVGIVHLLVKVKLNAYLKIKSPPENMFWRKKSVREYSANLGFELE